MVDRENAMSGLDKRLKRRQLVALAREQRRKSGEKGPLRFYIYAWARRLFAATRGGGHGVA